MGARSWWTPSTPSTGLTSGPLQPSCGQSPAPTTTTTPPLSPQPCNRKSKHKQLQQQQQQQHSFPQDDAALWPNHHMVLNSGKTGLPAAALSTSQRQQLERHLSVRQDLALDLPPCLALPDGEERPYGASTRLRIRNDEQEREIYREWVRPPPNRTVLESGEDSMPFRCRSVGILSESAPSSMSKSTGSGMLCWKSWERDDCSSRVVLDSSGQPVMMRSKSMSTGTSNSSSSSPLTVMVPSAKRAPANNSSRSFEASVKSRVRLLCEKVTSSVRTDRNAPPSAAGVDNAAFENCTVCDNSTVSSSKQSANQLRNFSSSSKLANLTVVACDAATQLPVTKETS